MGNTARIPALPLTACILAGPLPAALLAALAGSGGAESLLRVWGTLALFGLCYALVIGVPIALLLLRDPALPWRRWIAAALLAGLITTAVVLIWTGFSSARHLVAGQWDAFQVLIFWLVVPLVLFSAIVSRILIALWLSHSRTRSR
jgi:ethanolamine transporter EutH